MFCCLPLLNLELRECSYGANARLAFFYKELAPMEPSIQLIHQLVPLKNLPFKNFPGEILCYEPNIFTFFIPLFFKAAFVSLFREAVFNWPPSNFYAATSSCFSSLSIPSIFK
jgi:hypothetical protein